MTKLFNLTKMDLSIKAIIFQAIFLGLFGVKMCSSFPDVAVAVIAVAAHHW